MKRYQKRFDEEMMDKPKKVGDHWEYHGFNIIKGEDRTDVIRDNVKIGVKIRKIYRAEPISDEAQKIYNNTKYARDTFMARNMQDLIKIIDKNK